MGVLRPSVLKAIIDQMKFSHPSLGQARREAITILCERELAHSDGWISVNTMLPEPFVSVLLYLPDNNPYPTVHEGYRSPEGDFVYPITYDSGGTVTHWRPMPVPPDI